MNLPTEEDLIMSNLKKQMNRFDEDGFFETGLSDLKKEEAMYEFYQSLYGEEDYFGGGSPKTKREAALKKQKKQEFFDNIKDKGNKASTKFEAYTRKKAYNKDGKMTPMFKEYLTKSSAFDSQNQKELSEYDKNHGKSWGFLGKIVANANDYYLNGGKTAIKNKRSDQETALFDEMYKRQMMPAGITDKEEVEWEKDFSFEAPDGSVDYEDLDEFEYEEDYESNSPNDFIDDDILDDINPISDQIEEEVREEEFRGLRQNAEVAEIEAGINENPSLKVLLRGRDGQMETREMSFDEYEDMSAKVKSGQGNGMGIALVGSDSTKAHKRMKDSYLEESNQNTGFLRNADYSTLKDFENF